MVIDDIVPGAELLAPGLPVAASNSITKLDKLPHKLLHLFAADTSAVTQLTEIDAPVIGAAQQIGEQAQALEG
jgi:hypothetical protein